MHTWNLLSLWSIKYIQISRMLNGTYLDGGLLLFAYICRRFRLNGVNSWPTWPRSSRRRINWRNSSLVLNSIFFCSKTLALAIYSSSKCLYTKIISMRYENHNQSNPTPLNDNMQARQWPKMKPPKKYQTSEKLMVNSLESLERSLSDINGVKQFNRMMRMNGSVDDMGLIGSRSFRSDLKFMLSAEVLNFTYNVTWGGTIGRS